MLLGAQMLPVAAGLVNAILNGVKASLRRVTLI